MIETTMEYDLAFSFAGEDRPYVESLKDACEDIGLSVYYDEARKLDQWGLSFLAEQRKVYSGAKTKHFVPFISKHYFSKPIPTDEFRSAMMESTKRRYMLPIKLDNSPVSVEYLSADMQYIKSVDFSVEQIAQKLRDLVSSTPQAAQDIDKQLKQDFELPMPRLTPNDYNKYEEAENLLKFVAEKFEKELPKLKSYGYNYVVKASDEDVKIRVSNVNDTVWSLNIFYGNLGGNMLGYNEDDSMNYNTGSYNGQIESFFDRQKQSVAYNLQAFSFGGDTSSLSAADIVAFFWNDLSEKLERHHG
jgi:hypothetical protein